jgi:hypothetical protein
MRASSNPADTKIDFGITTAKIAQMGIMLALCLFFNNKGWGCALCYGCLN